MSADTAGREGSALWRVLTTPIGPPILPRIRRRPGPADVIRVAALPAPVAEVVTQVVKRTRLWRGERAEVAAELCSHFAEGLAVGRSPAELVGTFGEPRTAAILIRRAKRRQRPLAWHLLRRGQQGLAALVALTVLAYAGLALRYFTCSPNINHDYFSDLNAPVLAVPESRRAWPVYREAVLARTRVPSSLQIAWGPMTPDDPRWRELVDHVRANQGTIDLIHRAAERPSLGHLLTNEPDAEIWGRRGLRVAPLVRVPRPALLDADLGFLSELQRLANLLVHHACVAATEGNGSAIVRDITDTVSIAEHLREAPLVPAALSSFAAFNQALNTVGVILRDTPTVLTDAELTQIAHRVAAYGGGGPVRASYSGEEAFIEDLAQRLYARDGRITSGGMAFMGRWAKPDAPELTTMEHLALAVDSVVVVPTRAEFVGTYRRSLAEASGEAERPLYGRPGAGLREPMFPVLKPYNAVWPGTAVPVDFFLPMLRAANLAADQTTQQRDAVLTRIALELYKRRAGQYPDSLKQLVPNLLPAMPIDRYDGGPLKYVVRDGRPLLYAAGADRDDDGGRPPPPTDYRAVARWLAPETLRAFLASPSPAIARAYDGDWILWPPQLEDRVLNPPSEPPADPEDSSSDPSPP